jgi:hypothetical protein
MPISVAKAAKAAAETAEQEDEQENEEYEAEWDQLSRVSSTDQKSLMRRKPAARQKNSTEKFAP